VIVALNIALRRTSTPRKAITAQPCAITVNSSMMPFDEATRVSSTLLRILWQSADTRARRRICCETSTKAVQKAARGNALAERHANRKTAYPGKFQQNRLRNPSRCPRVRFRFCTEPLDFVPFMEAREALGLLGLKYGSLESKETGVERVYRNNAMLRELGAHLPQGGAGGNRLAHRPTYALGNGTG
jgi:hypothetical protein